MRDAYTARRGSLLQAAAWNGWAHRRGYCPQGRAKRKEIQRAMAELRQVLRHMGDAP